MGGSPNDWFAVRPKDSYICIRAPVIIEAAELTILENVNRPIEDQERHPKSGNYTRRHLNSPLPARELELVSFMTNPQVVKESC